MNDLKDRTQAFALRIVKLVESLPKADVSRRIGDQLLRAGTSVGANYRAACRARSRREFVAKLGIVEEECDEAIYWMEILMRSQIVNDRALGPLVQEAHELLAITVASINTVRRRARTTKNLSSGSISVPKDVPE